MHCVYILYSFKTKALYKGYTKDVLLRLKRHNNGEVRATKNGCPWCLVYYEAFLNKVDALEEEKFLKSGKGRERIKFLLANTLKDLEGCQSGQMGSPRKR